jgi:transposase InsO family protein
VPEIIYTDGGPQFLQDGAFDKVCQEWGIRHILSSPYMPRSNGHAEATVKQMKKLIQANLGPNGILIRSSAMAGLQVFRNTPREPTELSPAVMIFGHSIRDLVPMKREALLPEFQFKQEQRNLQYKQGKQQRTPTVEA